MGYDINILPSAGSGTAVIAAGTFGGYQVGLGLIWLATFATLALIILGVVLYRYAKGVNR